MTSRPFSRLFMALVFLLSLFGLMACGGGGGAASSGGGSSQTYFTATVVAGEGTTTSQSSMQVAQGQNGSVTVGLLPGYTNLVATGGNAVITGSTCTFGPVNANVTVTLSATKLPPTTFTVTIVAGEGTTTSQTSVQVAQGQNGSVTVGLLSGYENLVASGLNAAISGTTCTFGPVNANGTVTLSATKIIVPPTSFTVTIVAGEGTTASQTSVQVAQGQNGSVTVGLLSGYENLVASGLNAAISGTTCTFGPVNANGTVTLSATKIIVPPTTFTVTIVAGEGTTASQTSVQVAQGQSSSVTVGLLSGYENLVASGLNAAITGTTCTFGPVNANGTVTLSATKSIVYHTVTAMAGEGTTLDFASQQVADGQSFTATGALLAGYNTLVLSAPGGLQTGNSITIAAVTADITVTSSATKLVITDIPEVPGKIVFVVAPDVLTDMTPLINQFMGAVATDTGCESVLLSSPSTPTEIRTYLQGFGTDLRMAFLIGNVPMIYNAHDGLTQLSDHYYRALRYPFGAVYTDANGRYVVDITADSGRYYSWRPTNAVARIKGMTATTQLADIRAYLEKDLLMRNNTGAYVRGTTLVNATNDFAIDGAALLNQYVQHPLFAQSEVNFVADTSAQATKDAFFASLYRGEEISQLLVHGAPTLVAFRGQTAGDEIDVNSDTFKDPQIHAKYISFDSCSTGNFATDNFLAGTALFGNSYTLFVSANTEESVLSDQFFAQQARTRNYVLGVGRSLMTSYPYAFTGEQTHYFGDPTVNFRKVDLAQPRPKMVFRDKRFHQEFSEPVAFASDSLGEVIYENVVINNTGDKDLVLKGYWRAMDSATVNGQIGDFIGGNGFYFPDLAFSEGGTFNCTITVPAGGSTVLKVAFEPYNGTTSTNGQKLAGAYRSTMTLFSNDPEIGSFELVFSANVK